MENTNNNILEIRNPHTYSCTDSGVIKPVDGVDIELGEESTLGIMGESGSGRNVTALSVIGLLMGATGKAAEGEILPESRGLTKLDDKRRRKMCGRKISMIFQGPVTSLNPIMKIGDQIAECILIHNSISKQEAWNKVVEMLELTDVPRVKRTMEGYPFQPSGGRRQRIMIAMALVCKPRILIADEPTTALGVTIQIQVLDLMENLKQKTGTPIPSIIHDLGMVAEVCDDMVVMYSGRVVEEGDVRSIFANPSYPYTRGPLTSVPRLGEYVEELESIPDNILNPKYMPQGCKFIPRCFCAFNKCREEEPGFYDIGGGHISRCWLREKKGSDT